MIREIQPFSPPLTAPKKSKIKNPNPLTDILRPTHYFSIGSEIFFPFLLSGFITENLFGVAWCMLHACAMRLVCMG